MPEIKGNFFVSLSYCLVALFFVTLFAASCEEEKSVSDGLIDGKCGLTGQRVECNYDTDCLYNPGRKFTCHVNGFCFRDGYNSYNCTSLPGTPCFEPPDTFCNSVGECMPSCETHDDCPDGYCSCFKGPPVCARYYCFEGSCPDFTEPVIGTRICSPKEEFLEGECHSPTCEEGYERVGEIGCVKVDDGQ